MHNKRLFNFICAFLFNTFVFVFHCIFEDTFQEELLTFSSFSISLAWIAWRNYAIAVVLSRMKTALKKDR